MAYKLPADDIKEQLSRVLRYVVRLAPIVVIVGTITWFFLLRSPDGTNTSSTNETSQKDSETTASATPETETKVADNSEATKEETEAKEEGKLPETGPAGALAVAASATISGTLFWEWHLRRRHER